MKFFNYSEVQQNFSTVLDTAVNDDVIITRSDGSKFKIVFINKINTDLKSPFEDIKGIQTNVTMKDILEAIKQGRESRE
jgi:hypothetical protein